MESEFKTAVYMGVSLFVLAVTIFIAIQFVYLRDDYAEVVNQSEQSEMIIEQYRRYNKYNNTTLNNIETLEAVRYFVGDPKIQLHCDLRRIAAVKSTVDFYDTRKSSSEALSYDKLNVVFGLLSDVNFKSYLIYNSLDPSDINNVITNPDMNMDQVTGILIVAQPL